MNTNGWDWKDPRWTKDAVQRRASGRRHYHAVRRQRREARRVQVAELLCRYGWDHGTFARIARELGVHRCTVMRDAQAIGEAARIAALARGSDDPGAVVVE
jgi:hypothetical protein